MKKLFVMVVMMITSTTLFSQSIGKAKLGLSLEQTITQCQSVGYELVETGEDYAKFYVPSNESPYDFDVTLTMFCSPKSKIVWFGVMLYSGVGKKQIKKTFLSTFRFLTDKLGEPVEKKRRYIKWDTEYTYVYLENLKTMIKYTVSSTDAWDRVESEY